MDDQTPPRDGSHVGTHEYDAHVRHCEQAHIDMNKAIERNDERIDDLERKWDRYVGPIVLVSSALTVLLVVTNLAVLFELI